jgi:TonB family protein
MRRKMKFLFILIFVLIILRPINTYSQGRNENFKVLKSKNVYSQYRDPKTISNIELIKAIDNLKTIKQNSKSKILIYITQDSCTVCLRYKIKKGKWHYSDKVKGDICKKVGRGEHKFTWLYKEQFKGKGINIKDVEIEAVVVKDSYNEIKFYRVYEKPPKLLNKPKIEYPEQAKKMKLEGTVHVEIDIDSAGNVYDLRIVKSINKIFNEAAIDAAKNLRFKPAEMYGKPISVRTVWPVIFRDPR